MKEGVDANHKKMDASDKLVLARNAKKTIPATVAANDSVPTNGNVVDVQNIPLPPPRMFQYPGDQRSPRNRLSTNTCLTNTYGSPGLSGDPKFKNKPDNLPDSRVVRGTSYRQPRGGVMHGRRVIRGHTYDFYPGFMETVIANQSKYRVGAIGVECSDTEVCETLVSPRNEEETVSATVLPKDVPPLTGNVVDTKTTQMPPRNMLPNADGQWSPRNPMGLKMYGREFLLALRDSPESKKEPDNLPYLDCMRKEIPDKQPNGGPTNTHWMNIRHTDVITPAFMRTEGGSESRYNREPLPKQNSMPGKSSKEGGQSVIIIPLALEDVKLHESENAWKPSISKREDPASNTTPEDLFKTVRGILNKLTPENFGTLVSQIQNLHIDSRVKLQGVIDLVFEKAVNEPNFSGMYARMSKLLLSVQVTASQKSPDKPEIFKFRELLVCRCEKEFAKNKKVEFNQEAKEVELNAETDPKKKKELQLLFEEKEAIIKRKSLGNIRFIGELYKSQILTTSIMHRCIQHLLTQDNEESLEGVCKLLTIIGEDLTYKTGASGNPNDLNSYFNLLSAIAKQKGPKSVSARIRFMLEDLIQLRQRKWIPRRDDTNPKTMKQIHSEVLKESAMNMQLALSYVPNAPRRQDDRGSMGDQTLWRKRPGMDGQQQDGWHSVSARPKNFVIDTSQIKVKHGEIENISLGSDNQFSKWSHGAGSELQVIKKSQSSFDCKYSVRGNSANVADGKKGPAMPRSSSCETLTKPNILSSSHPSVVAASNEDISKIKTVDVKYSSSKTAQELASDDIVRMSCLLVEEFLKNDLFSDCAENVLETFVPGQRHEFVRECLNVVLEKTVQNRVNVGQLLCHLMKSEIISASQYVQGLQAILQFADDISLDVPKIWLYLAETVVSAISSELLTFTVFSELVGETKAVQFIIEVLHLLCKDKDPSWIRERWDEAQLKWTDFVDPLLVDEFVKDNEVEYTVSAVKASMMPPSSTPLTMDQIQRELVLILNTEQGSNSACLDHACEWISANVGDRVKEPQFIRALMTAICESAIEMDPEDSTLKLNGNKLSRYYPLLLKYVEDKEDRELQCIYAIQALEHERDHPQDIIYSIIEEMYNDNIFCTDACLKLIDTLPVKNLRPRLGKCIEFAQLI